MEINIQPGDIDALVKQKILESSFGKIIEDAIKSVMRPGAYDNPVEKEMKAAIGKYVREVLEEERGPQIKAAIREIVMVQVSDEVLKTVGEKIVDKIVEAFKAAY